MRGQADRAFAERVAAQTDMESSVPSGHGEPILALDQVNLTIPDGKTLAIVGPSGCGKSTLLRVIAGLILDYTGCVYYDDQEMTDVPPKDRYIGMVFQNYALYPHFESKGNLSFFFRVHKAPDAEAEERIRITSEMMGIGFNELLARKPGTLSGGQQQRVAIARAIVRNPRLFLFDEPLSNLDAKLRTQTRVEIKRLLHRFQITSIYVTHDQIEAMALGDQLAIMRQGRIEQVGTYQELREAPRNTFVAGFLGHPPMNLLTGGTVQNGLLIVNETAFPLPPSVRSQAHNGQSVTLGIRPEEARLVIGDHPLPEGIRLTGQVEVVEPDFAHQTQLAYVQFGSQSCAATGSLEETTIINAGDTVEIVIPTDKCHLFDTETELRIS
jgi:ABC-type sugar transport system ATPase subunit